MCGNSYESGTNLGPSGSNQGAASDGTVVVKGWAAPVTQFRRYRPRDSFTRRRLCLRKGGPEHHPERV